MTPTRSFIALILVSALLSAGCAAVGINREDQGFDPDQLDGLTPGRTTADEVCLTFGAPTRVVRLTAGNAYVYERSVGKATGFYLFLVSFVNYDERFDRIVFFFDAAGVLTHYGVSLDAGRTAYGLPF
jgi:hypothetical protein